MHKVLTHQKNPAIGLSCNPSAGSTSVALCEQKKLQAGSQKKYIDVPLLIFLVGLGLVLYVSPAQALSSLKFMGTTFVKIGPFLLFVFVSTAWMRAAGAEQGLARVFQGRPIVAIVVSTLAGVLTPLCSALVIPLIRTLLRSRVSLAVVMAYWLSSPIISPDSFLLTVGVVGLDFAIARSIAAVGIGLSAGFLTLALTNLGWFKNPLRAEVALTEQKFDLEQYNGKPVWIFWHSQTRRTLFINDFLKTSMFLTKWLIVIFFLESLMNAWIPVDLISPYLNADNHWAIPASVAVGIPTYLNGVVAIGFINGLMDLGMHPSAALAFIVGGSVTSIPAILAVYPLVKRNVFLVYFLCATFGAIICGYLSLYFF